MARKAKAKVTASAGGGQSGPVTTDEEVIVLTTDDVLERLLPEHNGNPHAVAEWLNTQHRLGRIRPVCDVEEIAPADNAAGYFRIVASSLPDGKPCLEYRMLIKAPPGWTLDHRPVLRFEQASLETALRGVPENRGDRNPPGRPSKAAVILIEAAVMIYEDGLPSPPPGEAFCTFEAFWSAVGSRLSDSPSETTLKDTLRPLYKRLKDASG